MNISVFFSILIAEKGSLLTHSSYRISLGLIGLVPLSANLQILWNKQIHTKIIWNQSDMSSSYVRFPKILKLLETIFAYTKLAKQLTEA